MENLDDLEDDFEDEENGILKDVRLNEFLDEVEKDPRAVERLKLDLIVERTLYGEAPIVDFNIKEVISILRRQGYWSGFRYNFFLTRYGFEADRRVFGNA